MKLAIANLLVFGFTATLNDVGGKKDFSFKFTAKRINAEEGKKLIEENNATPVEEFLKDKITGWTQQLVVDENNNPVEFSAEAFDFLLSVPGFSMLIYKNYLEAVLARDALGNSPRR